MNNRIKSIPVLIVGGGPVGLSLALCLSRQNVPSLLVEKHPGRTEHPRARGVSMRSMELFRQWGNITELLQYEFPREAIRFIWCESLQANEVTRIAIKDIGEYTYGPIGASFVTQDCVEYYLHQTLQKFPEAEIEFSKEMISFAEDPEGLTVRLLNRKTNQEEIVRTQYLIAADGAHSRIRKQLGIEMMGPDNLGRFCNVYSEFDITKWTNHRPSLGFFFTDPTLLNRSLFMAYGKNRWIFGMRFTPENSKEDFSDEYCLSEIRRVLGLPTLNIKIINKNFWTMAAQMAQRYRQRRVLLVGDAAHRLPPTGGLGMNTGIADAHNLAWKLAFVLQYGAHDALLDTYYEERAPVAKRNIDWSMTNAKRFVEINEAIRSNNKEKLARKLQEQQSHLHSAGLDLGFIYHSNIILSENEEVMSISPANYIPTTLPGSRAPYVMLKKNGETISTLDLFEKEYVLLIGIDGHEWQQAADELGKNLSFPLKSYTISNGGDLAAYEISSTGVVLVRPDGHVAWRCKERVENVKELLSKILRRVMLI